MNILYLYMAQLQQAGGLEVYFSFRGRTLSLWSSWASLQRSGIITLMIPLTGAPPCPRVTQNYVGRGVQLPEESTKDSTNQHIQGRDVQLSHGN